MFRKISKTRLEEKIKQISMAKLIIKKINKEGLAKAEKGTFVADEKWRNSVRR